VFCVVLVKLVFVRYSFLVRLDLMVFSGWQECEIIVHKVVNVHEHT